MDIMSIIPASGAIDAQKAHDTILEREREYKQEIAAVAAKLTPETFRETKDAWADLNKADDQLKALVKRIEAYAFGYAGVDALLTQVKATRKNLAEIHDENWEKYLALRDADKPAEPVHTYCIRVSCTDSVLNKVVKSAVKAGAGEVIVASPQSDKAVKTIQKWFEENV